MSRVRVSKGKVTDVRGVKKARPDEIQFDDSGRLSVPEDVDDAAFEKLPDSRLLVPRGTMGAKPGETTASKEGERIRKRLIRWFSSHETTPYKARFAAGDDASDIHTQLPLEHVKILGRVMATETKREHGTVFQAPGSKIEARRNCTFYGGGASNYQDGAVVIAAGGKDRYIGPLVSIAHLANVVNSDVGPGTFFGFNSRADYATIGACCVIEHNAYIGPGVIIPDGMFVRSGAIINTQQDADRLTKEGVIGKIDDNYRYRTLNLGTGIDTLRDDIDDILDDIAERLIAGDDVPEVGGVVGTNMDKLLRKYAERADWGIHESPNGEVFFVDRKSNTIGTGSVVRGNMVVSEGVSFRDGCTIRSDEPDHKDCGGFHIGKNVVLGACMFHALETEHDGELVNVVHVPVSDSEKEYWSIFIGDDTRVADGALIHGRAYVGRKVEIGERAIVFGAEIGDGAKIGEYTTVWDNSRVGEGVEIGYGGVLYNGANIGKGTATGDNFICGGGLDYHKDEKRLTVGEGCTIGNKVRIESGGQVGKGCTIANGIVIRRGIEIPDGVNITSQEQANSYQN